MVTGVYEQRALSRARAATRAVARPLGLRAQLVYDSDLHAEREALRSFRCRRPAAPP